MVESAVLRQCVVAETSGEPETKEELVDSEYGGGQDTEPLRPSSTGIPLYRLELF